MRIAAPTGGPLTCHAKERSLCLVGTQASIGVGQSTEHRPILALALPLAVEMPAYTIQVDRILVIRRRKHRSAVGLRAWNIEFYNVVRVKIQNAIGKSWPNTIGIPVCAVPSRQQDSIGSKPGRANATDTTCRDQC